MMMPRIYKLIIAFGASILFSSIAHAQDDGAPPILDLQLFIQEVQNQYPLLQVADLQTELAEAKLLEKAVPAFESIMIHAALKHTGGRKRDAAELLGWGRNTLTRKLKELGISGGGDEEED
jgi:DNA-binding NtrC family response regulator